jgi:hypothetical protein
MDGTTTDKDATPAPAPATASHCLHRRKQVLMDNDDGMMMGRQRGMPNAKTAQETLSISLGPQVYIFIFYFISFC